MLCLLGCGQLLYGQTAADSIYVEEVKLIGHKKTRPGIIFREMGFGRGDYLAIADLEATVAATRANLMNTGLFSEIRISYEDWRVPGNRVTFVVNIRETWYVYPIPVFRLADRNFNVWWREQNGDLNRVDVGLKFTHYNFTGRRDKLRTTFQYGYTRKYGASYSIPYLGKQKNFGLGFSFDRSRRREQNYQTLDNQQIFYADRDAFVYRKMRVEAMLSYRRKLYVSQQLRLGYSDEMVVDSISLLNPDFFGEGRSRQRFFRLEYEWQRDLRDVRNYPWKGSFARFRATKEGLGITGERNGLSLRADYRLYTPLGEKVSINTSLTALYSPIRSRQPFLENRGIGFGSDGLVGYQFYVVDGLDMLILRAGVRRHLFKGRVELPKLVFVEAFRIIPWRILLSAQIDQGYANDPYNDGRNPLANTWLYGGSLGLDLVLFYDMVFGVQYHHNHLGEGSLLLKLDINL